MRLSKQVSLMVSARLLAVVLTFYVLQLAHAADVGFSLYGTTELGHTLAIVDVPGCKLTAQHLHEVTARGYWLFNATGSYCPATSTIPVLLVSHNNGRREMVASYVVNLDTRSFQFALSAALPTLISAQLTCTSAPPSPLCKVSAVTCSDQAGRTLIKLNMWICV